MKILTHSTPVALWQEMIHEAVVACTISLSEELEAYLTYLLMRYTDKPSALHKIIAVPFLEGIKLANKQRDIALQEVGDKCLLLSGLFPKIAQKRLVKISYFVNIGQAAYLGISKNEKDIYQALSLQFVNLMDVLQSLDNFATLLPLEAYEQWNETQSQRAFQILKQYTSAIPLSIKEPKNS